MKHILLHTVGDNNANRSHGGCGKDYSVFDVSGSNQLNYHSMTSVLEKGF